MNDNSNNEATFNNNDQNDGQEDTRIIIKQLMTTITKININKNNEQNNTLNDDANMNVQ